MKKLLISVFSALLLAGLFGGSLAKAGVNDFVINNFKADYYISNYAVGGTLETREQIDVNFSAQNHGILRALPQHHQGYKTKLTILDVQRDGQPEPYTTYSENDNLVLKIGDPNKTITGAHTYQIKYLQERIVRFEQDGKQRFYWDVNGTEWQQPFERVEAHVYLKGAPLDPEQSRCYTGRQGSTASDCEIAGRPAVLIATTNRQLAPGETLTIDVPLDGVAFLKPTFTDKLLDNVMNIIGIGVGVVIAGAAYVVWRRYGRDLPGKGIVIPEYDPPKGLSPAEVGLVYDFRVDGQDVSSTLIDLAVRGMIRIHEDHTKVLGLFSQRVFSVELMNDQLAKLRDHERVLIESMFEDTVIGARVDLNALDRAKMRSGVESIRRQLQTTVSDRYGLFEKSSGSLQAVLLVCGFVSITLGFFAMSIAFGLGFGLIGGGLASLLFASGMAKRTHAGAEAYQHILGLRLYLNTAEKTRLKMMQSVDRPYAEPSKTVELFETLLPYAVALGVEESWANQFDNILSEPPSWYQGGSSTDFRASYLASNLAHAAQGFGRSFESSSSSSGGSAGGGGGGGGGGGW